MHAAVAAIIFAATLVTIVVRPRGITEAWAASVGAVLMLVTASVSRSCSAALAGADLGPNLTPVGALSTMLWLAIVRRRGVEVSAWDFIRIGLVVAPLTLLAALFLIALSFHTQ
jgi:Na+/H+ antiporter NhaD/arsenite permease-like protein